MCRMKDETIQVNPRLNNNLTSRLDEFMVEEKILSRNEAVIKILQIFFGEMESKRNSANVVMLECVLALIFDSAIHPENLKKNAENAANMILAEMNSQVLELDESEVRDRLGKWHKINPFKLKAHSKGVNVVYKIQHRLGRVFSEFQAEMYRYMLVKIGATVVHTDFDDYWYSVEVQWSNPQ